MTIKANEKRPSLVTNRFLRHYLIENLKKTFLENLAAINLPWIETLKKKLNSLIVYFRGYINPEPVLPPTS